jgi:4-hydroxy-tetrahydrodipicolinate reductase
MASVGIIGIDGRMGNALVESAGHMGVEVAGGIGRGGDCIALAKAADALIDFSSPEGLVEHVGAAVAAGKPIVVGTTGLDEQHRQALDDAAYHVPVLQTGNTSLGVTLLSRLVRDAANRLGKDWDIEIVELHHRDKVDAPSGTALQLGKAAARGRGMLLDINRTGHEGGRKPGDIGFASLRGGTAAGDHMVIFAGNGERIELIHRAESRSLFAAGAMRAALWLMNQPPGRYEMDQVLGM